MLLCIIVDRAPFVFVAKKHMKQGPCGQLKSIGVGGREVFDVDGDVHGKERVVGETERL